LSTTILLFFFVLPSPPTSTLFPYTTLFRSLIFPVGLKKHYPLLADICNREWIGWRTCHCFNMDEWLDWECRSLPLDHPFSLEGFMRRHLYDRLDAELRPPEANLCFPSPRNMLDLSDRIRRVGGVDLAIGGFGVSGHTA